jgi:transposase
MTIVADRYTNIVGVDTHARTHTYVILDTRTGAVTLADTFPTSPPGLDRALAWISRHTTGDTLVTIEGIGSYGADLARKADVAGFAITEANRVPVTARVGRGKTDRIDAELIARSVLGTDLTRLRQARDNHGQREALRILIDARDQLNVERTATINALTALIRTTGLDLDARRALTAAQIRQVSTWRSRSSEPIGLATARIEAIRMAKNILTCDNDLASNYARINQLVKTTAAAILMTECGIGPVNAATILLAWSHPGRLRNQAAFVALAGANPIPASSGNTVHYRLNKGGDRRLNRALQAIMITRMRCDPTTQSYRDRYMAQGHSYRDTMRTLKRYLARHIYRVLEHTPA